MSQFMSQIAILVYFEIVGICNYGSDNKVGYVTSCRWSFGPNPAWGSIETTTIGKTYPTLLWTRITFAKQIRHLELEIRTKNWIQFHGPLISVPNRP